jgi:tetratricopeptide (TPR) repeat protein
LEEDEANIDLLMYVIDQNIINKVKVLNSLAIASFEQQQYDSILTLLQKALEYDPIDADSLYNLAFILFQFGEKELAQRYLKQMSTDDQLLIAAARELEGALLR